MLHLVKLCVGVDSLAMLRTWQHRHAEAACAAGRDPRPLHRTRNMPRRRAELVAGGSLYWVVRRRIIVRQRIQEIRQVADDEGRSLAEIILDPNLVLTTPIPRRPFQGWRYLSAAEAPADLESVDSVLAHFSPELRAVLDEIGVR